MMLGSNFIFYDNVSWLSSKDSIWFVRFCSCLLRILCYCCKFSLHMYVGKCIVDTCVLFINAFSKKAIRCELHVYYKHF